MNLTQLSDSTMKQVAIGALLRQRSLAARAIGGTDSTWQLDRVRAHTAALARHDETGRNKKRNFLLTPTGN
jgi:hypothetical protein